MQSAQARAVKRSARLDATHFVEVDGDYNGEIDFDAFEQMQPRGIREHQSKATLRSWFSAINTSRTEVLTAEEFFVFMLFKASVRFGTEGLYSLIRAHDDDSTGKMDTAEFQRMCNDLGMGAFAAEIFAALDADGSGEIQLIELMSAVLQPEDEASRKAMACAWIEQQEGGTSVKRTSRRRDVAKAMGIDVETRSLNADDMASLRSQLSSLLRGAKGQAADVMALFNLDDDGSIGHDEFVTTLLDVCGHVGNPQLISELFSSLDIKATGMLGHEQIAELMSSGCSAGVSIRERAAALTLEPREGEPQYGSGSCAEWTEDELRLEIQILLLRNKVMPIELLTMWDWDESGQLSKREFLANMRNLFQFGDVVEGASAGLREATEFGADEEACLGEVLWQTKVKPTAVKLFDSIARGDKQLSMVELVTWIDAKWPGVRIACRRRISILRAQDEGSSQQALRAKQLATEAGLSSVDQGEGEAGGFVSFQRRHSLKGAKGSAFDDREMLAGLSVDDRLQALAAGLTLDDRHNAHAAGRSPAASRSLTSAPAPSRMVQPPASRTLPGIKSRFTLTFIDLHSKQLPTAPRNRPPYHRCNHLNLHRPKSAPILVSATLPSHSQPNLLGGAVHPPLQIFRPPKDTNKPDAAALIAMRRAKARIKRRAGALDIASPKSRQMWRAANALRAELSAALGDY